MKKLIYMVVVGAIFLSLFYSVGQNINRKEMKRNGEDLISDLIEREEVINNKLKSIFSSEIYTLDEDGNAQYKINFTYHDDLLYDQYFYAAHLSEKVFALNDEGKVILSVDPYTGEINQNKKTYQYDDIKKNNNVVDLTKAEVINIKQDEYDRFKDNVLDLLRSQLYSSRQKSEK